MYAQILRKPLPQSQATINAKKGQVAISNLRLEMFAHIGNKDMAS